MRRYNLRKSSIIMTAIVLVLISTLVLLNIGTESDPFDLVRQMRKDLEEYKLISSKQTDDGILLYSAGVVNEEKDNIYFVDMVKKTLIGYKWTGGGGHINRALPDGGDYIISMQLLNEDQNITPTAFGIILDDKILSIKVGIRDELSNLATNYNGRDKDEKFYVVHFERNIADVPYLIIRLMYADDNEIVIIPSDEDMERLQEGKQIYFTEGDFEKVKK